MTTAILMATYNGADFLAEQLDSLRQQTAGEWVLLCRDDGSTDATPALLRHYAAIDPRIHCLEDGGSRRGAVGNFATLMAAALAAGAQHFFFCDQDDIWLPDKIALQLHHLRVLEDQVGRPVPLLVHTELQVVDARLAVIGRPRTRAGHGRDAHGLGRLLAENIVTGCTMAGNRALLQLALPMPSEAIMHDWWCALCAALAGRIVQVERPTVLYRQHAGNVLGAGGRRGIADLLRQRYFDRFRRYRRGVWSTVWQAQALRERRLRAGLEPSAGEASQCLDGYASLHRQTPVSRLLTLTGHRIRRAGTLDTALMAASLLFPPANGAP